MGGAKKSTWIGGTVFVGVVLAAAAWFLLISPTFAAAAEVRAAAEDTRAQNEILSLQVVKLKADFEKLPEYRAELEQLRVQVPTDARLADWMRQLDQIATAHGVVVTALTPSAPQAVVPAEAAAPPATDGTATDGTATDGAATDGTATADGTGVPAPVVSTVPDGMVAIPISVTVLGPYDGTVAFLHDLQRTMPQLFLVSGFTGTAQDEAAASGGKPATHVGDQELIVTGYTYVLPDLFATPAPVDPAAPAPTLPGAIPGKNPVVPIPGR